MNSLRYRGANMSRSGINDITNVLKSDISQLSSELTETAIDSILSEGLLKDVPVVGTIAKIASMGQNIKDWFFTKKVCKFLLELDVIELEKRQMFVDELEDKGEREEVGETLIVILDRLDHLTKASMIGRLFQSYILERISFDELMVLSAVVERIYIVDLKSLLNNDIVDKLVKERLYSLGIYSMTVTTLPSISLANYNINQLGKQLKEILGTI
jgi:hypothetical protein